MSDFCAICGKEFGSDDERIPIFDAGSSMYPSSAKNGCRECAEKVWKEQKEQRECLKKQRQSEEDISTKDMINSYIEALTEQSKQIGRLEAKVKQLQEEKEELTQALLKVITGQDIIYITWPALELMGFYNWKTPYYPPVWPEYPPCPSWPCLIRGAR